MLLRLPALAAMLAAPPGPSSAPPAPEPTPATKAADRAIFDQELSREKWGFMFRLPTGFWTPSLPEIMKMEERLPTYLREQLDAAPASRRGARGRGAAGRRVAPEPPPPAKPPLWKRAFAYKRQYVGLVKAGRHVIWGNFFCTPPRADWRHEPAMVDDGGDCYFQVEYDVDTGRFSGLMVNGEA
jgi:hypothetical protein